MKKLVYTIYGFTVILLLFLIYLFYSGTIWFRNERLSYEKYLQRFFIRQRKTGIGMGDSLPKGTNPAFAAFQEYVMTMDPKTKVIPYEKKISIARDLIHGLEKQYLKSGTYPLTWKSLPANTGGRARAFMFDPNDKNGKKAWVGSVTGGLWYTEDFFDHSVKWQIVDNFWENLSVNCITFDPSDPMILYVGTGEGQTAVTIYRESSGVGYGILKSTDGGQTWFVLNSTRGFTYVNDLVVRIENGKPALYACVRSGRYKGKDHYAIPSDGLYRSEDGGESWEQVLPNIPGTDMPYSPSDIEISASNRIFVGTTNNIYQSGGGVILFSDNGMEWTVMDNFSRQIKQDTLNTIPGRVMLTSAPSNPDRIYALIASGHNLGPFVYIYCFYLARSDDAGSTWQRIATPWYRDDPNATNNWAFIAWHALAVKVHPANPDVVFVGGADIHRSTNAGMSWEWITNWALQTKYLPNDSNYVHADQHAFNFVKGDDDFMVSVTDGGVFYTRNSMAKATYWFERNEGFNTMQFYTCAAHPEADSIFYLGGTQDNSTMKYTTYPVTDHDRIIGGDGAFCFIDEDEPNVQLGGSQFNNFAFSDNYMNGYKFYWEYGGTGIFINPCDYDHRLNILYANMMTFSGEYGGLLLRIKGIPSEPQGEVIQIHSGNATPFSHIKISPYSPERLTNLYIGTQAGRLYRVASANYNYSVTPVHPDEFPSANISCIDIGRSEAEVLVTFSNYNVSSVWYTQNGGERWLNKEGDLPGLPVRWCIFHPQNKNHVMLATEVGVWTTENISAQFVHWEPVLNGMANVRVDMLKVRESDYTVLAATHGRGLYTLEWKVEEEDLPPMPEGEPISVFPNPFSDFLYISFNLAARSDCRIEIVDIHGRERYHSELPVFRGEYFKQIDLQQLSPGIYILNVNIGDTDWEGRILKIAEGI